MRELACMETRETKRAQMFDIIDEYRKGEESQLEFCTRVGMKIHCFRYWLNRYRQHNESGPGFVRVTGDSIIATGDIELRFPNGVRVGLGHHPDAQLVAQLIRLW